jgi:hypothetical protein
LGIGRKGLLLRRMGRVRLLRDVREVSRWNGSIGVDGVVRLLLLLLLVMILLLRRRVGVGSVEGMRKRNGMRSGADADRGLMGDVGWVDCFSRRHITDRRVGRRSRYVCG